MPRANPDVNYEISIHALLAESDPFTTSMSTRLVGFLSTLSLRRATYAPLISELHCLFLSTLSLRRAAHPGQPVRGMPSHFYPRSPCGERPGAAVEAARPQPYFYPRSPCGERLAHHHLFRRQSAISIHALLAESDQLYGRVLEPALEFLSTLSLRRATELSERRWRPSSISIHALLAESDMSRCPHCREYHISIHALLAESDENSPQGRR